MKKSLEKKLLKNKRDKRRLEKKRRKNKRRLEKKRRKNKRRIEKKRRKSSSRSPFDLKNKCGNGNRSPSDLKNNSVSDGCVYNNIDFCINVANNVMLKRAKEGINFAISPLCLHLILSLAAKGSSGDTLNQFLSFLKVKSIDDLDLQTCRMIASLVDQGNENQGGPLLSFVNGAWITKGLTFNPSFLAIADRVYKAVTQEVDFENEEVIGEINSWVANATKGAIEHLLIPGSIDNKTKLVLANALYFKGAWEDFFVASKTRNKDFQLLNRRLVQVPFMNSFTTHLYGSYDGYKVVRIPYESGEDTRKFSMDFLVPDKKDGLPNLIQKVNSNPRLLNQQLVLFDVDLWIPRFKFSFEFEASKTLNELGLVLPFVPGGLTETVCGGGGHIYLSKIFHKSCIEVNEEGTEAAASTVTIIESLSSKFSESAKLVADHPFIFIIREETSGIVFFIGAVLNPLLDS